MASGTCPKCAMPGVTLFRCTDCGDIRCNSVTRSGSKAGCAVRPGGSQAAQFMHTCRVCKKGKYRPT